MDLKILSSATSNLLLNSSQTHDLTSVFNILIYQRGMKLSLTCFFQPGRATKEKKKEELNVSAF